MKGMSGHPCSLESILGHLVRSWERTNPAAIRALDKFNKEHGGVLLLKGAEKQAILEDIRLKSFTGSGTGQRIDLTKYKPKVASKTSHAQPQKGGLERKEGS